MWTLSWPDFKLPLYSFDQETIIPETVRSNFSAVKFLYQSRCIELLLISVIALMQLLDKDILYCFVANSGVDFPHMMLS